MIWKMLLTFEEAQILSMLRKKKKITQQKAADFLCVHTTTLLKYETGRLPIPIKIWDEMKALYDSCLDGVGEEVRRNKQSARGKNRIQKNIILLSPEQEKANNMKAMRSSQLDNQLQVSRLLKSLAEVF